MNRSQGYVVLATLGLSFILVFSYVLKSSGMSSFEQLTFRFSIGLLILSIMLLSIHRLCFARKRDVPFFAAIGFVYAIFTLTGLSAIAFGTPIAVTVALIYTQPMFTALIAFFSGKERVSIARTILIFLGVVGAFLVAGLNAANQQINIGILFPIAAGFLYAVYLRLKRQAPVETYTPLGVLFNTFLFALPFLLGVWLILRNFSAEPLFVGFTAPDGPQLFLVTLLAFFSTILPYGLLNYVKPNDVSPTTEGMLLLGDPLLHSTWAALLLKQFVSETQYLGAALILFSAALNLKITPKNAKLSTTTVQ